MPPAGSTPLKWELTARDDDRERARTSLQCRRIAEVEHVGAFGQGIPPGGAFIVALGGTALEVLFERVAGIDIGTTTPTACVGCSGRRA